MSTITVRPSVMTPAEKHTAIQQIIDRCRAEHPHTFINCPACEGVGYRLDVDAVRDDPADRLNCRCCDGSGLVLPEEADAWFENPEAYR